MFWSATYSTCVVYIKTVIHLSVGEIFKNSTQWVHESNASCIVSAVEICLSSFGIYGIEQEV